MLSLYRKHRLPVSIAGGIFFLVLIMTLSSCAQNETSTAPTYTPTPTPTLVQDLSTPIYIYTPTSQYLDTPTLINQAFGRGEITEEERLLYLAYALYEPESLPAQYRSRVGWFGESYAIELSEALMPPEVICSMSPHVRSEILRLYNSDPLCN
jgi:hypothetical protein